MPRFRESHRAWLVWRTAKASLPIVKIGKWSRKKYLARDFLSIQQFIADGELENAYWLPGVENPASGLTEIKGGN